MASRRSAASRQAIGAPDVELTEAVGPKRHEADLLTSGSCHTVTSGHSVVPSPDGRSLYFLRPAKRGMRELWTTDVQGRHERSLGEIGPFRLPDIVFDVSRAHLIVWPAFHEGKVEIWMAEIK